jgi:hypothetical protein
VSQPTVTYGPGNATSGAQTSITVTLPTHQTGDLLVVQIDMTAAPTVTRPALWNILRETANGTTIKQGLYYKVATSSAETNPTFTVGATARTMTGIGMRIRDHDGILLPNGSNGMSNAATGNNAGPFNAGTGGLTLDQPDCLVIHCVGNLNGTDENITAPTNYTEGLEVNNGTTIQSESSWRANPPEGSTGTTGATGTMSARWVATMFFVRSADYATYRSHSTVAGATAQTTFAPALPTGHAENDALITVIYKENTAAITAPANWTVLVNDTSVSTHHIYIAIKRRGATESAPSFSWTGGTYRSGFLTAIIRTPTSGDMHDVVAAVARATAQTLASNAADPNVTNTTILGIASQLTGGAWTPGTGAFEKVDTAANTFMQTKVQEADTSTGTLSATTAGASSSMTHTLVVLKSTSSAAGATTAYKDSQARFRLLVGAYRDTQARFRLLAGAFLDAQARFRLSALGYRDAQVRLGMLALAYRDSQARLRVLAVGFRDSQARFRTLVLNHAEHAARFAVESAIGAYRDTQARFRLAALAYRDAESRFRLLTGTFRDTAARYALKALATIDAQGRVRTAGQGFNDAGARLVTELPRRARIYWAEFSVPGFAAIVTAYRDVQARFRLLGLGFTDTAARFCLLALNYVDHQARAFVAALAHADAQSRLRTAAGTYRDVAGRFSALARADNHLGARLNLAVATVWDHAARFTLAAVAVQYRDAAARAVLLAAGYRDHAARFGAAAGAYRDAAARLVSAGLVHRDVQARYATLAANVHDVQARYAVALRGFRDHAIRALLAAPVIRDVASRFRLVPPSGPDEWVQSPSTGLSDALIEQVGLSEVILGAVALGDLLLESAAASDLHANTVGLAELQMATMGVGDNTAFSTGIGDGLLESVGVPATALFETVGLTDAATGEVGAGVMVIGLAAVVETAIDTAGATDATANSVGLTDR